MKFFNLITLIAIFAHQVLAQNSMPRRCTMPLRPGTCGQRIPRYYFDDQTQQCKLFFYSGCDGNPNRFMNLQRCENICIRNQPPSMTPAKRCTFPLRPGTCGQRIPRFFYDQQTQQCKLFFYSGCGGNPNRFMNKQRCENICTQSRPPSQTTTRRTPARRCTFPLRPGTCGQRIPRFFYDQQTQQCKLFFYSGCGGNPNRFMNLQRCENICIRNQPPSITPARRCTFPLRPGTCGQRIPRFYFDQQTQQCKLFFYSGCGGNPNRFMNKQRCENICTQSRPPSQTTTRRTLARRCTFPLRPGTCGQRIPRFFYDQQTQQCKLFFYSGCGGNPNRFMNKQRCENICIRNQPPSITPARRCTFPLRPGTCGQRIPRFYFDQQTQQCKLFFYSGCGGNPNRFMNKQRCENICLANNASTTRKTTTTTAAPTTTTTAAAETTTAAVETTTAAAETTTAAPETTTAAAETTTAAAETTTAAAETTTAAPETTTAAAETTTAAAETTTAAAETTTAAAETTTAAAETTTAAAETTTAAAETTTAAAETTTAAAETTTAAAETTTAAVETTTAAGETTTAAAETTTPAGETTTAADETTTAAGETTTAAGETTTAAAETTTAAAETTTAAAETTTAAGETTTAAAETTTAAAETTTAAAETTTAAAETTTAAAETTTAAAETTTAAGETTTAAAETTTAAAETTTAAAKTTTAAAETTTAAAETTTAAAETTTAAAETTTAAAETTTAAAETTTAAAKTTKAAAETTTAAAQTTTAAAETTTATTTTTTTTEIPTTTTTTSSE